MSTNHSTIPNISQNERIISTILGAGIALYGAGKRSITGVTIGLIGGALVQRGLSGECKIARALPNDLSIERAITVNKDSKQLFDMWKRSRNLFRFLKGARITKEQPGETIEWESSGTAEKSAGTIKLVQTPGRGTELKLSLHMSPPGHPFQSALGKLLGSDFASLVEQDLKKFKQLMETGETPTVEGQPTGKAAKKPGSEMKQ